MNSPRYCGPSPAVRKYYSDVNPARQSIPRGSWSIDGKVLLQKCTDTVREAAPLSRHVSNRKKCTRYAPRGYVRNGVASWGEVSGVPVGGIPQTYTHIHTRASFYGRQTGIGTVKLHNVLLHSSPLASPCTNCLGVYALREWGVMAKRSDLVEATKVHSMCIRMV